MHTCKLREEGVIFCDYFEPQFERIHISRDIKECIQNRHTNNLKRLKSIFLPTCTYYKLQTFNKRSPRKFTRFNCIPVLSYFFAIATKITR